MVDLSIVVLVYQRVISEIMNIHEHPLYNIHESRQVSQSLYPGLKKIVSYSRWLKNVLIFAAVHMSKTMADPAKTHPEPPTSSSSKHRITCTMASARWECWECWIQVASTKPLPEWRRILINIVIASGKRLHSELERSTIFNGKIHMHHVQ